MIIDEINSDSTVLSVLLVILTLFTTIQSDGLGKISLIPSLKESKIALRNITMRIIILVIFSISIIIQIFPVVKRALGAHGTSEWQNSLYLFIDLWVALCVLFLWQVSIAKFASMRFFYLRKK